MRFFVIGVWKGEGQVVEGFMTECMGGAMGGRLGFVWGVFLGFGGGGFFELCW